MFSFDPVTVKLPCEPVAPGAMVMNVISGMFEVIDHWDGFGLAANQVGFTKQIIVINCSGFRAAVVNPKIVKLWGGLHSMNETCLSDRGRRCWLARHKRCTVTGLDANAQPVTYKARGLLARVFQHEIDHMSGITIFDRKRLGIQAAIKGS